MSAQIWAGLFVSYFPSKKSEPKLKEAAVKILLFAHANLEEEAINDPSDFASHDNIATDLILYWPRRR